jgi:MFS family permease
MSTFGTWFLVIGVPLRVFDLTGSTAATGAAFVAETVPALVLGPAAGVLVDRLDRRRVMMTTDVVRALAVSSMLLVDDSSNIWILYVAIVVENGAAQFFRPSRQAIIPVLVGSGERLPAANAMFGMIDGLVRLFGSVGGGILYAAAGFETLVILDAVSYLVSAAGCCLIRCRTPSSYVPRVSMSGGAAELRDGLHHVWQQEFLRGLLVVTALFYLANGTLTALLVPFARTQLHAGTMGFGYLLAALGLGYLAGTPLAHLLIDRYSIRTAVLVSVPCLALCFGLAFGPRHYTLTIFSFALAGAPSVVLLVAVATAYQRQTPDQLLGRVAAAFLTVEMVVSVIGAATGSSVAEQAGLMPVIGASITLLVFLVLALPQLLPRHSPQPGPGRPVHVSLRATGRKRSRIGTPRL